MNRPHKLVTAARLVLGLVFALSGLNHLLWLVSLPPSSGDTALFIDGLRQAGYFFPLLGICELMAGALLLSGRAVPLALTMVAPIAVNVAAFHAVLAPQGLAIAVLVVAATAFLAWHHREAFAPLLIARGERTTTGVRAAELLLGLVFTLSGLAGLLGKTPPPSTAQAEVMMRGLSAAGYFLPLLGGVQIAAGLLLVAGRYVALALVALAPLVVQILAYRLFVATPAMLPIALGLTALTLYLARARGLFVRFFASPAGSFPVLVSRA
jgi:putative oxidoreductase